VSLFKDRTDAGTRLAKALERYRGRDDLIVLALPRGGVPVAYEVAAALRAPLDVFIVRKLGVPDRPEFAMGAIATGGVRVLNEDVIRWAGVSPGTVEAVAERERLELERRERTYRGDRPPPAVRDKTVILVDDGLATGATMRAAVEAVRRQGPAAVVVAVPTAPIETCAEFEADVDDVVCAETPRDFYGVGMWYRDFSQTNDAEVQEILAHAAQSGRGG
jgi:putative phosphoribosyl transferase